MTPIGISVGQRGKSAFGHGRLSGYPRLGADGQKSAEGSGLVDAHGRLLGEGEAGGGGGGGVPPDLQFASSWSTALGTSLNARMDQGRTRSWQYEGDSTANMEVVASNGMLPSQNCMYFQGNTGQLYMTGFETPYVSDLAENQYYTYRFLLLVEGATLQPTIDTNPGGTRGNPGAAQESYFPSGASMTPGNLYEIQVSFARQSGNAYTLEAIVYVLNNSTHQRESILAQSIAGGTNDWGFPSSFTGGAHNWQCVRDFNWGIGETLIGGDMVHPFWPGWWAQQGSYNADSMGSHHWPVSNVVVNRLGWVGCFTVCKGPNASREFPLREWSTDEEQWSP